MNEIAADGDSQRSVSAEVLLAVFGRLLRTHADLVGVTVGARVFAPERVFTATDPEPAFLWSSSPGICEVGLGALHRFTERQQAHWPDVAQEAKRVCSSFQGLGIGARSVEPRFYGGASFVTGAPSSAAWAGFCEHEFVLPRLFYRCDAKRDRASVTLFASRGELEDVTRRGELADLLHFAASRGSGRHPTGHVPPLEIRSCGQNPDRATWATQVRCATDLMERGRLEKVVLARELVLECNRNPDIAGILRHLLNRSDGSVCFAFRSGMSTFLGATPEWLVTRRGCKIRTEALAGSAAADDPAAIEKLRRGDKDQREHAFVVKEIVARLAALGAEVSVPDEPSLRQFGPVLHLRTSLEASRLDAPHVLLLGHHLHPTPAVGGIPLQTALEFIRQHESFRRGRYASPAGWFDGAGDGELVVALRSGLVRDRAVHLFAGAGLVRGSEAEAEWRETELKFRSFLDALGVYPSLGSFKDGHGT